jgi:serine protease
MRKLIATLVILGLAAAVATAQEDDRLMRPSARRWLVKFATGTTASERERIAAEVGAEPESLGPYADFLLFHFPEAPTDEAIEQLLGASGVVYAEREVRYRTAAYSIALETDDPLEPLQWSHRMINLPAAHLINFGSDPAVTVAVLDTGIAYLDSGRFSAAPDLAGTIVLSGYDFVSDDDLALDEGDGKVGHGTFMAGVIAQTTHNALGTAGIAFNASLLPVRVADRRGLAWGSDLARGIRFAVANGAAVIFIGVAGQFESEAVAYAVRFAHENGVAVIAPAGNSEQSQFPARLREVLSVGAVDAAGRPAYYSPGRGPVDIYAPGGDLRQGVDADADGRPDGVIAESFMERRFNRLEPVLLEGTSVAAAHAAGVAALLISHAGPTDPDRLFRSMISSARSVHGLPLLDAARLMFRASTISK